MPVIVKNTSSMFSECPDNAYSWRCQQTCGNCSNGEPCHYVNGSCPSGCDAGVHDVKCNIGSTIYLSNVTLKTTLGFIVIVKSYLIPPY